MNFATTSRQIEEAYALAQERYAAIGVDTEQALATLRGVPISLHCWQGDDVLGFEEPGRGLGGGLMATGNYPAAPAPWTNSAAIWTSPTASSPAIIASTFTPCTRIPMRDRPATRSSRATFRAGQTGPKKTAAVSTSTPRCSPTPGRRRLHPRLLRQRHPPVLDPALHRLPRNRQLLRQRAGHARNDQYLDP